VSSVSSSSPSAVNSPSPVSATKGVIDHQGRFRERTCSRTSASGHSEAAPRSSGFLAPSAAAAHEASRNSCEVLTRSAARARTRSGSHTMRWVSAGSTSTSSSIRSTRTGASDSIPSTAMPSAILPKMSARSGYSEA